MRKDKVVLFAVTRASGVENALKVREYAVTYDDNQQEIKQGAWNQGSNGQQATGLAR